MSQRQERLLRQFAAGARKAWGEEEAFANIKVLKAMFGQMTQRARARFTRFAKRALKKGYPARSSLTRSS